MPLSLGEPIRQGSVQPQEDGGRREHGEEEGDLCLEHRPKDIEIADGRKPEPVNQDVRRESKRDQASCDDD